MSSPASAERRPPDIGLEGVRGLAALGVALSHVLTLDLLMPDWPLPSYARTLEAGHSGVLLFFVLSGYLIAWTNGRPYSPAAAGSYGFRRLVRIAPIYYVAAVVTLIAASYSGFTETLRIKLGFLFCLQNYNGYFGFALNPPRVNGPLWSLNYEVLYYGVFLLLWRYQPRLRWVFGPAFLVGMIGWITTGFVPLFLSSYACGWIFWAAGWWLARQPLAPAMGRVAPMATYALLFFANARLGGVARLLNLLHLYCADSGMIGIADLGGLPVILLLLSTVACRTLPYRRWIETFAWAICVLPVLGMLATGRLLPNANWVVGAAALVPAALLLPVRSLGWLRPLAWFGGISYAFYILHFPLLYIVAALPLPREGAAAFGLRLLIWVPVTLVLSWILERGFQPWIKRQLTRRASHSA